MTSQPKMNSQCRFAASPAQRFEQTVHHPEAFFSATGILACGTLVLKGQGAGDAALQSMHLESLLAKHLQMAEPLCSR